MNLSLKHQKSFISFKKKSKILKISKTILMLMDTIKGCSLTIIKKILYWMTLIILQSKTKLSFTASMLRNCLPSITLLSVNFKRYRGSNHEKRKMIALMNLSEIWMKVEDTQQLHSQRRNTQFLFKMILKTYSPFYLETPDLKCCIQKDK